MGFILLLNQNDNKTDFVLSDFFYIYICCVVLCPINIVPLFYFILFYLLFYYFISGLSCALYKNVYK